MELTEGDGVDGCGWMGLMDGWMDGWMDGIDGVLYVRNGFVCVMLYVSHFVSHTTSVSYF